MAYTQTTVYVELEGAMARDRSGNTRGATSGSRRAPGGADTGRIGRQSAAVPRPESTARESALVDRIASYLNGRAGCRVRKTHGSAYTAGFPDLIGCCWGLFVAIEVKRPGERPTPLQASELRSWRLSGGQFVVWADRFDEFEQAFLTFEALRK